MPSFFSAALKCLGGLIHQLLTDFLVGYGPCDTTIGNIVRLQEAGGAMSELQKPSLGHMLGLALVLVLVWLGWSGYFLPLILTFGVISISLTVWVSRRLQVVDVEGQPINGKLLTYVPWLIKEIIVANIDVIKRILAPDVQGAISPTWTTVNATQKTQLYRVVFANSITLTPGTVSVEVGDDKILVHALSKEGAEALAGPNGGEMGQRCCGLEG